MYVNVCMCVCLCVCACTCVCIYMCMCAYICVYVCMSLCMCICMSLCGSDRVSFGELAQFRYKRATKQAVVSKSGEELMVASQLNTACLGS